MKTRNLLLTGITFIALQSCSEKKETENVTIQNDTVVVKEYHEVQKEPIIEKTDSSRDDGTSISVDKNGVEISTKNGNNSTDIELKDNKK